LPVVSRGSANQPPSQSSGICSKPNSTSAVAAISSQAMLRIINVRIVGLLPRV